MIKVQDWIATIPDEDKHVAYVGEDKVEQRVFLLCGEGWQDYRNWSFHLDMAFDPESITNRDIRQVVQTTRNRTENTEEAGKIVDEVTTKETYTVCDEEMANYSLTDIASLDKEETEDGLRLTWQVLRQHTLLPGKLRATLRAQGDDGNYIKKSAMMVFEVDAAINAAPAARPARSEFEEMEQRMDNLLQDARWSCEDANHFAVEAEQSYNATVEAAQQAEADAQKAQTAQAAANQSALDAANAEQNATRSMENCAAYQEQCAEYVEQCREVRRINVRDYGAVGDGTTDDRGAILDAFAAAKEVLPCEVYFPAGTYAISDGMVVELEPGTGGLRVCGAGIGVSMIRCMPQFRVTAATKWGLLTIQPTAVPTGTTEYLHDVTITNLTLCDPQPGRHKLDSQSTVGLWLNYIERATISHCLVESTGSSAVAFTSCEQALVTDLYTERTCAVLGTNGAVSVEGMGIIVSGCHIHTSGNCAIREKSGNGNLFIGNVVGAAVATVGSQTIALYNVDMRKLQT